MDRVKQISIDILVDDTVDGVNLADEIANILEERQFVIMGCGFNEDMTETYIDCYPDLMKEVEQKNGDYFEAVEVCPHCDSENVYPMWDTEVSGFVAVCKYCGKEIFLCDECQHTVCEDGEVHECDWRGTKCGGQCHRGITRY